MLDILMHYLNISKQMSQWIQVSLHCWRGWYALVNCGCQPPIFLIYHCGLFSYIAKSNNDLSTNNNSTYIDIIILAYFMFHSSIFLLSYACSSRTAWTMSRQSSLRTSCSHMSGVVLRRLGQGLTELLVVHHL